MFSFLLALVLIVIATVSIFWNWQLVRKIRKQQEQEATLRKQNQRLQLILDSIPAGISYTDTNQCFRFANQIYKEWFATSQEQLIGKSVREVIGEEGYRDSRPYIEQALSGQTVTFEKPQRINNQTRVVSVILIPDWDEQGGISGYYALITDITARSQAKKALQQVNQELQTLIENYPAPICLFNNCGYYTRVNSAAAKVFNCSPEQIVGRNFDDFLPTDISKTFQRRLQQLQQTQIPKTVEDRLPTTEGNKIFQSILFPISNQEQKDDSASLFGAIAIDITQQKQFQQQLQNQLLGEQLLNQIVTAIHTKLNLDRILECAAEQILQAFGVSRSIVALDPDLNETFFHAKVATAPGVSAFDISEFPIRNDADATWLLSQKTPFAVDDIATEPIPDLILSLYQQMGFQAILGVAICYAGQIKGIVCLHQVERARSWTEQEKQLLKQVADQLGIAIYQAQLYQELQSELSERKKLEAQFRHQATHDRLTGLPNRSWLIERLETLLQTMRQSSQTYDTQGERFAVLYLDLDHFKSINDTFGHDVGDELLKIVARRLKGCLRETDTIARIGGDEFIVLLEGNVGNEIAVKVAFRIHQVFKEPVRLNGQNLNTSTSIGITFGPADYTDHNQILRDADFAMYRAKNHSRGYELA